MIVASRIFCGTRFVLIIGEGCAAVLDPVPDSELTGKRCPLPELTGA